MIPRPSSRAPDHPQRGRRARSGVGRGRGSAPGLEAGLARANFASEVRYIALQKHRWASARAPIAPVRARPRSVLAATHPPSWPHEFRPCRFEDASVFFARGRECEEGGVAYEVRSGRACGERRDRARRGHDGDAGRARGDLDPTATPTPTPTRPRPRPRAERRGRPAAALGRRRPALDRLDLRERVDSATGSSTVRPAGVPTTRRTRRRTRTRKQPELAGATRAQHQLGNDNIKGMACNDGYTEFWSQDRLSQWANLYQASSQPLCRRLRLPERRRPPCAARCTWTARRRVLHEDVRRRLLPATCRRRDRRHRDGVRAVRQRSRPARQRHAEQHAPAHRIACRWFEYWDVNPYDQTSASSATSA